MPLNTEVPDPDSLDNHCPGPRFTSGEELELLRLAAHLRRAINAADSDDCKTETITICIDLLKPFTLLDLPRLPIGVRRSFVDTIHLCALKSPHETRAELEEIADVFVRSITMQVLPLRERLLREEVTAPELSAVLQCHSNNRTDFNFQYDDADHFFDALLDYSPPRFTRTEVGAEGLFYQPTPITLVRNWLKEIPPSHSDTIFELGCGTGRAAFAMALLSEASIVGVEISSTLCRVARKLAELNKISRFCLIENDVRNVDFSGGTIFYLFNPFKGELLDIVIDKIRVVAEKRPITVVAMGDCRASLETRGWLNRTGGAKEHQSLGIYTSRKC